MLRINEEEKQMMRSLYDLRYFRVEQIRSLWWSDREREGVRIRLSRMRKEGLLVRVVVHGEAAAVRLAVGGIGFLRRFCEGDFNIYDELRPIFLPHLLATNDVFFALAGDAAHLQPRHAVRHLQRENLLQDQPRSSLEVP